MDESGERHALMNLRSCACLLATLLLWTALLPRAANAGEKWSPHDRRLAHVQSIVFSPDGTRLMAAYYVDAINEPGTDWDAWVVQWDLKNETRTILRNACWPVAFAPDGQTVAMGTYTPSRIQRPHVQLGI